MSDDSTTIREFLVALGWKNDESGQRRFTTALEGATLRAKLLGDAIEATAIKIRDSVSSAAEDFEKLYWTTQYSRVSAKELKGLEYAFSQVGLKASDAAQTIALVNQKLQENPGNKAFFDKFGLVQDKATKQISLNAKMAEDGVGKMNDVQLQQFLAAMGLSQQVGYALRQQVLQIAKYQDEYNKTADKVGFDPKQAAKDGKEFEQTYRSIMNSVQTAADGFFANVEHQLLGPLKAVSDWAKENPDAAAIIFGTAGAVGVGGAAYGATKAGGAVLSKLFGGGALEGSATALTGSATALDGSATALTEAAAALGGGKALGGAAGAAEGAAAGGAGTLSKGIIGALLYWLGIKGIDAGLDAVGHPAYDKAVAAGKMPDTSTGGLISDLWNQFKSKIGLGNGSDLKVDGSKVSSSNPMPVTFGQQDQQNAEWNASQGGGGSGGGNAGGSGSAAGGAVPDTRNWWQKHAPTWAGGKPDPNAGSAAAPVAPGKADSASVAAQKKQVYDFWRSKGLDDTAARVMVANQQRETGFGSLAYMDSGDKGTASGIHQWHNDRRAAILHATGIDVRKDPDMLHQLQAQYAEGAQGLDKGAAAALKILKTPGLSAADYSRALVHLDERSGNQPKDVATNLAYFNRFKPSSSPTVAAKAASANPYSSMSPEALRKVDDEIKTQKQRVPYGSSYGDLSGVNMENLKAHMAAIQSWPAPGTHTVHNNDNSSVNHTHNNQTKIYVNGEDEALPRMIGSRVERAYADAARNLPGATQ